MTPNNLVNMAWLKGLDAIAVADHNRALNLPACQQVALGRGLLLLPAIEVTCREEVHVLCYFPTVDAALAFDEWLYPQLLPLPNRPIFFGEQCVMDDEDHVIGMEERVLIQASKASIAEVAAQARALGGVPVPAHINRGANSLLGVLGIFPADVTFATVEVAKDAPPPSPPPKQMVLYSSDAHRLGDIAEPGHPLAVGERSIASLLACIARGNACV